MSDLPTVSLANIGDTFDVREILFPLSSAGGECAGAWSSSSRSVSPRSSTARATCRSRARGTRSRPGAQARLVRLPVRVQPARRLSTVAAWEVSARLSFLSGRPFTPYDQACPPNSGAACTTSRASTPNERQTTAGRHPRGPHLHRGRAATQPVPWRAERDQPPQLRQLQLEPPHQRPAVRRAAGHLPDSRIRLAVLDTMSASSPGPPGPPHVLITGATGYIGGRLVPVLEAAGVSRCLARRPAALASRVSPTTEVSREISSTRRRSIAPSQASTWPITWCTPWGRTTTAKRIALPPAISVKRRDGPRFAGSCPRRPRNGRRGIQQASEERIETGQLLRESGVPVVEFRASVVIGSGSLSFELIRARRAPAGHDLPAVGVDSGAADRHR